MMMFIHGSALPICGSMNETHLNSVVSTPKAKYCTADCSNMYLETGLPDPQYVRSHISLIPKSIQKQYKLDSLVTSGGYVYARIGKAWYGLKESGFLANQTIVNLLKKHGYHQAKHTKGLFNMKPETSPLH